MTGARTGRCVQIEVCRRPCVYSCGEDRVLRSCCRVTQGRTGIGSSLDGVLKVAFGRQISARGCRRIPEGVCDWAGARYNFPTSAAVLFAARCAREAAAQENRAGGNARATAPFSTSRANLGKRQCLQLIPSLAARRRQPPQGPAPGRRPRLRTKTRLLRAHSSASLATPAHSSVATRGSHG